jgi:hypothetical protein
VIYILIPLAVIVMASFPIWGPYLVDPNAEDPYER